MMFGGQQVILVGSWDILILFMLPSFMDVQLCLFEGKPVGTPDAGVFWRVISEHKVKSLFTAPTAFRAIKKEDPNGNFF